MIDEDTMPEWLKTKMAEASMKKQTTSTADISADKSGFIPLPDGTPVASTSTPTTTVDTSQPPPIHAGGLLPPPPMAMPLVSPFSLNPRLMTPMAPHMSIPPGLMPNVPIGVPPPNLPGALMSNQLIGMGSPFTQAPPGLIPPMPMPGSNEKPPLLPPPGDSNTTNDNSFSANMSEDNMDIEMEDADKDKPIPLSDQLLASISGSQYNDKHNDSYDDKRPPNRGERDSRTRDRNDRRDMRPRRNSRDRGGRDRDNRDGRDNRDRDRDRDRDRNDRRSNRWSDREYRGRERNDRDRDDKKDQSRGTDNKPLAERLRDMAHGGERPPRDRSVEDKSFNENQPNVGSLEPINPSEHEGERRIEDISWRDPRHAEEIFHRPNGPMDEFDPHMRHHPNDFQRMDHPDFESRIRPDFEGRRRPFPEDMAMDPDRYDYELRQREMFDRRDFRGPGPDIDDFDPRGRGHDFFPRDGFGPRGPPMMRGDFPPRPFMGRPPGPPMFHPRGMGPRGPRPGKILFNLFTFIEKMWIYNIRIIYTDTYYSSLPEINFMA